MSTHLVYPLTTTSESSGGAISFNTRSTMGLFRQILVKPPTESTQYDIKLTNPSSIVVYEREDEVGTLAEEVDFPAFGIYTVDISNATEEGSFTVQLMIDN